MRRIDLGARLVVLIALGLPACGASTPPPSVSATPPGAAGASASSGVRAPTAGIPAAPPATAATPTTVPAAPQRPPAPAAPVAAMPMAATAGTTSAIVPVAGGGPHGRVTVTVAGSRAQYHLVVTGLAPGTTHTIHDHLGSCDAPQRSRHLAVLAVSTADSGGAIVADAALPAFDAGSGRIVIVYASAAADVIVACAQL